jgi:hypothetical protein
MMLMPRAGDGRQQIATRTVLSATTAGLVLLALFHVRRDGRNIPLAEDWLMVPALLGKEPRFWSWVWAQNNEHRAPISRLLYLGLLRTTHDFRVGMLANIALAAGVTILLLVGVARARGGRSSVADLVIPLTVLHLGHWENLMWGWQLAFLLVFALLAVILFVLATAPLPLSTGAAALLALAVVLLPFGGGTALPFVPPMVVALIVLSCDPRIAAPSRILLRVGAAGSSLAIAWYFVGWVRPTWVPANPGSAATGRTLAHVLALSWGPAAEGHWRLALLATVIAVGGAVVAFASSVRGTHVDRFRLVALASFLVGAGGVALGVAWSRAALVPTVGLPDRYALATLPILLGSYLALVTLHPWPGNAPSRSRRSASAVGIAMALVSVVALPLNMHQGASWQHWYDSGAAAVLADIDRGSTTAVLARNHREYLMHWDESGLAWRIELLRAAHIGPFARALG